LSSDSDDDERDLDGDVNIKAEEMKQRGRKGREQVKDKSAKKTLLGKRRRNADSDEEMLSDESDGGIPQEVRGSLGKGKRSMTPA